MSFDDNVVREIERRVERAALRVQNDPNRPIFHFLPPAQWMNDPNGTIYHNGHYHLFYQYNPHDDHWNQLHWGHASSRDLVHWEHRPLALYPSHDLGEEGCWSGCTWTTEGGAPAILYTSAQERSGKRDFEQWAAIGTPDLDAWEKHGDNPVLSRTVRDALKLRGDWRDPFLYRVGGVTYMLLAAALMDAESSRPQIVVFRAVGNALTEWRYEGVFFEKDEFDSAFMECPTLVPIEDKWVLMYSPFRPVEYEVGTLTNGGTRFRSECSGCIDHSSEFYATNAFVRDGRPPIVVGWIRGFNKGQGWNGCLSLPRELAVDEHGAVRQRPLEAFNTLRRSTRELGPVSLGPRHVEIAARMGRHIELECTLRRTDSAVAELRLFADRSGGGGITITISDEVVSVGTVRIPVSRATIGSTFSLHAFFDATVLELFLADGRYAVTNVIYLRPDERRLLAAARDGAVSIVELRIHEMNGVW